MIYEISYYNSFNIKSNNWQLFLVNIIEFVIIKKQAIKYICQKKLYIIRIIFSRRVFT